MECLVASPFRCSFSSSCCQIQWIVTELLNLCCCVAAFIRTKSPVWNEPCFSMAGAVAAGASQEYLWEREEEQECLYISLCTLTLFPEATEEISQLRLNMAAIRQSFCLIPWRFNQTCVFVTRFILRNNCLKKSSYFSAVSQFAAPVVNIHLHPVSMFSASGNSHQIISTSLLLGSCTICVQMFLLLTWKSGCVVPETFINLRFSSWVCCWNLIIWL